MRLLLVEDNERLAALISKRLSENAFAVDAVGTVEDARAALDAAEYSAILLDMSLPDGDGGDVLRSLRKRGRGTPVLVATARADVVQRVQTLNEGADDYLVKPFSLDELLARVRALLRRPAQLASSVLSLGNVTLDTTTLTLTIDGTVIDVPRREIAVLAALMRRKGQLLPKQKLEEAVYSFDDEVTPNAVEAVVSRIRKRLEARGATVTIIAMRGLGYVISDRARC